MGRKRDAGFRAESLQYRQIGASTAAAKARLPARQDRVTMRILFVLENYFPHLGGVEMVFKNLCEGLAKKHEVTVITRRLPNTKAKETMNRVKIIRVSSFNS